MIFEYDNNIKCTKEEAWKLITEIERRPDWIHFQEKCYWLDKKPAIIGSTYQEVEVFLGFHLNVKYTVTAYKEFERMTSKCDMYPFHQKVEVTMKENKDKTVYCKLHIEANLGVLGLLPKSIIKNRVDALVQPLVDKFLEILETESSLKKK
jgi:hypothetical protein